MTGLVGGKRAKEREMASCEVKIGYTSGSAGPVYACALEGDVGGFDEGVVSPTRTPTAVMTVRATIRATALPDSTCTLALVWQDRAAQQDDDRTIFGLLDRRRPLPRRLADERSGLRHNIANRAKPLYPFLNHAFARWHRPLYPPPTNVNAFYVERDKITRI